MFGRKIIEENEHSFWISYADMLIGLLISFMVIALILFSKKCPICPDQQQTGVLKLMSAEFKKAFMGDSTIVVTDDGTVRFRILGNKDQLFNIGSDVPTKHLDKNLDAFIPKYLDIVFNAVDSNKLNIKEIRIEGHTDSVGLASLSRTKILYNYELSSKRAFAVQSKLFYHSYYNSLEFDKKEFLFKHIINCGYGTSMPLDEDGNQVSSTRKAIENDQSRRIEFRIITDTQ